MSKERPFPKFWKCLRTRIFAPCADLSRIPRSSPSPCPCAKCRRPNFRSRRSVLPRPARRMSVANRACRTDGVFHRRGNRNSRPCRPSKDRNIQGHTSRRDSIRRGDYTPIRNIHNTRNTATDPTMGRNRRRPTRMRTASDRGMTRTDRKTSVPASRRRCKNY